MFSLSSPNFSPTKHNNNNSSPFFLRNSNPRIRIIQNYYNIFPPSSSDSSSYSSSSSSGLGNYRSSLSLSLSLSLRRLRSGPSATASSSLAEAGDDRRPDAAGTAELPEMARAFGVSSRTAFAVCAAIAFAALALPPAMPSMAAGGLKTRALAYATLLSGFYMAWNIGANDVANAMGTSVGSGALTLRQAVLTAAVLEFAGAFLMGTHVTSTMQKGILVASVFRANDSLLFAGLLSSLAAAGTWLQVS